MKINGEQSGRAALVVGGTRGIGWSTARALAAEGADVAITGRDAEIAERLAKQLSEEYGGRTLGIGADVSEFAAAARTVRQVVDEFSRLDVLVVNAGVMETAVLGGIRQEHVVRILSTNVTGAIATVQAGIRAMTRRGSGSIILLSSVVGRHGAAGQAVYAASKAALVALAMSAAREWGPRGIRVNAVAPGVIRTDLTAVIGDELLAEYAAATPLRRLGAAEDVAELIRFLASDRAAFITGQVIGVDGGFVP